MIKKSKKIDIAELLIYISILLISVFPILGENGYEIQKYFLWFTIAVLLVHHVFRNGLVINRLTFSYILYILFSIVSIAWSVNNTGAYIRIIDMIRTVMFMIIVSSSCRDKEDIFKYLDVYTIGVVIISFYCIVTDLSSLRTWARLGQKCFEFAGQNQIYYSCILIYATTYSIYKVLVNKENRTKYLLIAGFLFICGLLTAIRKCLFIPLIFFVLYTLLSNRKNFIKGTFYMIILVGFIAVVFVGINRYFPSMSNRIMSVISDFTNNVQGTVNGNSYSSRKWLREKAWDLFTEHPINGVGIGQFRYYAAAYGMDLYSHNNFLEILANTGIIGFIIYYSMFASVIFKALKLSKLDRNNKNYIFILAFLFTMLVMEYGQVDYYQLFFLIIINLLDIYVDDGGYLINYNKKVD